MTHEKLVERYNDFGEIEFDKQLYIEYLTVLNYMPDSDFYNMLNVENISDVEFHLILDFYYQQECYLLLFKLLRDYRKERLVKPNVESIKKMTVREDFEERQRLFFM